MEGGGVRGPGAAVCLLLSILAVPSDSADFPQARISNGLIEARLYLPDVVRGSYRSTCFDWSGIIYSLRCQEHEYFGQWYPRHDPAVHDAITGPVEESFLQNEPGIKLGVGLVSEKRIVDNGKGTVHAKADRIEFVHISSDGTGFVYGYRKVVWLVPSRPELVIEHTLKNKGRRVIGAEQYNHNFFVIDGQPSGPGVSPEFRFDPRAIRDLKGLLALTGRQLTYVREFEGGQNIYTELEGFGASAKDYDFKLEGRNTGAGVRIKGDRPLSKLAFRTRRTTLFPEPFIAIHVSPRSQIFWNVRYEFFSISGKRTD
jgi:hypothetical protein